MWSNQNKLINENAYVKKFRDTITDIQIYSFIPTVPSTICVLLENVFTSAEMFKHSFIVSFYFSFKSFGLACNFIYYVSIFGFGAISNSTQGPPPGGTLFKITRQHLGDSVVSEIKLWSTCFARSSSLSYFSGPELTFKT